jgi:hypothetical protein
MRTLWAFEETANETGALKLGTPLFTEVRGIVIMRTSPLRSSNKFGYGDSHMAYEYRPFGGCD